MATVETRVRLERTAEYFTAVLSIMDCGECGAIFGVTREFDSRRRDDGKTFYCPSGHARVYRETEKTKLEKQLASTKQQLQWAQSSGQAARDQAKAAERSARAYKGHLTRMRKRIANGVCPVPGCQRHFTNVMRHISTQHPDWEHLDAIKAGA